MLRAMCAYLLRSQLQLQRPTSKSISTHIHTSPIRQQVAHDSFFTSMAKKDNWDGLFQLGFTSHPLLPRLETWRTYLYQCRHSYGINKLRRNDMSKQKAGANRSPLNPRTSSSPHPTDKENLYMETSRSSNS